MYDLLHKLSIADYYTTCVRALELAPIVPMAFEFSGRISSGIRYINKACNRFSPKKDDYGEKWSTVQVFFFLKQTVWRLEKKKSSFHSGLIATKC